MAGRYFTEAIQFGVVKANLEKNKGRILCELCGKQITSIRECHFDHIVPYAKGGASTLENCQILCVACNLKKRDRELQEIALEEKARRFLSGKSLETEPPKPVEAPQKTSEGKITKEKFDQIVGAFIREKGDIHQIDFNRAYNHLPGISYVAKYYGTLNELKKAFGITDLSANWNRESIAAALHAFVSTNGTITQKDIKKENGLPSVNCILHYYPEYRNFSEIKRGLCELDARGIWTKEEAIEAGKRFVAAHNGKLTQRDCKSANGLPPLSSVYRLFGDLPAYQRTIGSTVSKNIYVSEQAVEKAVEEYFGGEERIVESRERFFATFPYGIDVIRGRYKSFDAFAERFHITVRKTKKAKYSKQEIDSMISDYVKTGKPIPHHHDLTKEGLPAANVIMRYYAHWREPFEIYRALYRKIGRPEQ